MVVMILVMMMMVMIMMTMMIIIMTMIMMKTLTGGSGGGGGLDFQGPTLTMDLVMAIARLKIITSRAIKNNRYIKSYKNVLNYTPIDFYEKTIHIQRPQTNLTFSLLPLNSLNLNN